MKRTYDIPNPEEDLFVDDLAVAAAYAAATAPLPSSSSVTDLNATNDQDEIELEDALCVDELVDVQDNNDNDKNEPQTTDTADIDGDDADDDVSDVDLEEQLRQMVDVGDDEAPASTETDSRPRTAHEIDPYSSNQETLEFLFDVSDEEKLRLKNLTRHHLKVAGNVRHLLPSERTVVIQSIPGEAVLEEGTILVVCTTLVDDESSSSKIIPLGRVLEVFGPVSQPLYSVRLPEPQPVETTPTLDANATMNEYDPWAETGDFTNLLRRDTNAFPIYYIPEGVRVIDPALIMQASGRGSDASNFYDEEITNPNDLDYSDDEEERMAKRKGRPQKQGIDTLAQDVTTMRNPHTIPASSHYSALQGFHHASNRLNQVYPTQNIPPQYPIGPSRNTQASGGAQTIVSSEQEESDTVYF